MKTTRNDGNNATPAKQIIYEMLIQAVPILIRCFVLIIIFTSFRCLIIAILYYLSTIQQATKAILTILDY